jgi:pyruvyltransferase
MVKVYYWKAKANFGDLLTSLLIERFSHLSSEWAEPKDAELVVVGSILEHIPEDWTGVIAGAGKLHERTQLNFPNARILAVRGPLTAKNLKGNFVLADPGLLADELINVRDKKYDLGIIPHWTDTKLEHDPRFTKYNPKIIRVGNNPLGVIREISLCKKIISSSLHGIILADAFGIPRRIEMSPRMLSHAHQEGGMFKWLDYSASLNRELKIGITEEVDRNVVVEKQYALFDVFEEITTIFS